MNDLMEQFEKASAEVRTWPGWLRGSKEGTMPEQEHDALVKALAAHPQLQGMAVGDLITLGSRLIAFFVSAKSGAPTPVDLRGVHLLGDIYDLTGGNLQKRPKH